MGWGKTLSSAAPWKMSKLVLSIYHLKYSTSMGASFLWGMSMSVLQLLKVSAASQKIALPVLDV